MAGKVAVAAGTYKIIIAALAVAMTGSVAVSGVLIAKNQSSSGSSYSGDIPAVLPDETETIFKTVVNKGNYTNDVVTFSNTNKPIAGQSYTTNITLTRSLRTSRETLPDDVSIISGVLELVKGKDYSYVLDLERLNATLTINNVIGPVFLDMSIKTPSQDEKREDAINIAPTLIGCSVGEDFPYLLEKKESMSSTYTIKADVGKNLPSTITVKYGSGENQRTAAAGSEYLYTLTNRTTATLAFIPKDDISFEIVTVDAPFEVEFTLYNIVDHLHFFYNGEELGENSKVKVLVNPEAGYSVSFTAYGDPTFVVHEGTFYVNNSNYYKAYNVESQILTISNLAGASSFTISCEELSQVNTLPVGVYTKPDIAPDSDDTAVPQGSVKMYYLDSNDSDETLKDPTEEQLAIPANMNAFVPKEEHAIKEFSTSDSSNVINNGTQVPFDIVNSKRSIRLVVKLSDELFDAGWRIPTNCYSVNASRGALVTYFSAQNGKLLFITRSDFSDWFNPYIVMQREEFYSYTSGYSVHMYTKLVKKDEHFANNTYECVCGESRNSYEQTVNQGSSVYITSDTHSDVLMEKGGALTTELKYYTNESSSSSGWNFPQDIRTKVSKEYEPVNFRVKSKKGYVIDNVVVSTSQYISQINPMDSHNYNLNLANLTISNDSKQADFTISPASHIFILVFSSETPENIGCVWGDKLKDLKTGGSDITLTYKDTKSTTTVNSDGTSTIPVAQDTVKFEVGGLDLFDSVASNSVQICNGPQASKDGKIKANEPLPLQVDVSKNGETCSITVNKFKSYVVKHGLSAVLVDASPCSDIGAAIVAKSVDIFDPSDSQYSQGAPNYSFDSNPSQYEYGRSGDQWLSSIFDLADYVGKSTISISIVENKYTDYYRWQAMLGGELYEYDINTKQKGELVGSFTKQLNQYMTILKFPMSLDEPIKADTYYVLELTRLIRAEGASYNSVNASITVVDPTNIGAGGFDPDDWDTYTFQQSGSPYYKNGEDVFFRVEAAEGYHVPATFTTSGDYYNDNYFPDISQMSYDPSSFDADTDYYVDPTSFEKVAYVHFKTKNNWSGYNAWSINLGCRLNHV